MSWRLKGRLLRLIGVLLAFVCVSSAFGAPRARLPQVTVTIRISPGATYKTERNGNELNIVIRDNKIDVRKQVGALRTRAVTGALVLSGRNQETIVRLNLLDGLVVKDRLARGPARIILELGPPPRRYRAATQAQTEAEEERSILAQLDTILGAPNPGMNPMAPGAEILCIGSRVMYPVPLPEIPVKLDPWIPVRPNFGRGRDARLLQEAVGKLDAGDAQGALNDLKKFERRYPKSRLLPRARYYVVEAMFAAADSKKRSGARLEAIEQLRVAIRRDPNNPARAYSLYLAGQTYFDLKYYHEASTMFSDLLKVLPKNDPARVHVLLALGWSDHHRFASDDSLKYFREALPLIDDKKKGHHVLAMASIMAHKGHYHHVLALLDLIRQHWPESVDSPIFQVLEAESLYRLDRYLEARPIFERIREWMGAKVPRIYEYRIGESLMQEKKYKEARKYFQAPSTAVSSESRRWQEAMQTLRILQMDMITDQGDTRRIINLEKLRRLRADNPFVPVAEEVVIEFIKYYGSQGSLADALGMLRTFLNLNRSNSHRNTMVALIWEKVQEQVRQDFKAGRLIRMLGLYEYASPIVASEQFYDPGVAYLVARAYLKLGLYDKAYKAVTEAFFAEGATRRLSDEAFLLLAEIQRRQGRYPETLRTLTFLRQRTDSQDTLRLAALEEAKMYEAKGDYDLAVNSYANYIELEPDLSAKASSLSRAGALVAASKGCAKGLELMDQAARFARMAQSKEQRHAMADIFYRLGECQFSLERYLDAAESFVRALAWDPDHELQSFARYALARSYANQGRNDEAALLFRILAAEKDRSPDDPWVRLAGEAVAQYKWKKSLVLVN